MAVTLSLHVTAAGRESELTSFATHSRNFFQNNTWVSMSSTFLCSDVLYYIRVHAGLASLFCVLCSALDYFLKIWLYIFFTVATPIYTLYFLRMRGRWQLFLRRLCKSSPELHCPSGTPFPCSRRLAVSRVPTRPSLISGIPQRPISCFLHSWNLASVAGFSSGNRLASEPQPGLESWPAAAMPTL